MSRPDGATALVTGATRGIGAAIATELARDGWIVGVGVRGDASRAQPTLDAIAAAGGTGVAIVGDVTDPGGAEAILGALAEHGPVLALVNNAGVRADGLSPQLSDDDWDLVVNTNLTAAFKLTRRAVGPMLRARHGRIVNIASIVGMKANAGQANYAAAKAGLIGMTKTVAVEVARRGVTVNAVAPGFIETDMTEGVAGDAVVAAIPARRLGTPYDVAACVRFLASDDAAYITGQAVVVDGGLSA